MATTKKKAAKKKTAKKKTAPKPEKESVEVIVLVPPSFPKSMSRAAQNVAFARWAAENGLDLKDPETLKRYS